MFTLYNAEEIEANTLNSLIQSFLEDKTGDNYLKYFHLKFKIDENSLVSDTFSSYSPRYLQNTYFNTLLDNFPFLALDSLNSIILIKGDLNTFDENILEFLIEEEDTHSFEIKSLIDNFKVIVVDGLPWIYYQIIEGENFQKIIIGFSSYSLCTHPSDLLEKVIFAFSKYAENSLIPRIEEYLDVMEIPNAYA
jgi:hypothetical protein